MMDEPTVFVVDDDRAVRDTLRLMIESIAIRAQVFATAHEFLEVYDAAAPGCLVVDVQLPGISGMELQMHLKNIGAVIPVIVITGFGDVEMAVKTMKAGAFDFLLKPMDGATVLRSIRQAIKMDRKNREGLSRRTAIAERAKRLTARERQVMDLVVAGLPNKAVAARLNVSQKTVEAHRANAMRKMEASSLPELVRHAELITHAALPSPGSVVAAPT